MATYWRPITVTLRPAAYELVRQHGIELAAPPGKAARGLIHFGFKFVELYWSRPAPREAFKRAKSPGRSVQVRLDFATHCRLQKFAAEHGISRAHAARIIIVFGCKWRELHEERPAPDGRSMLPARYPLPNSHPDNSHPDKLQRK